MTVTTSRNKPRKQKFPNRAYDGLSQYPSRAYDGLSHIPGRRRSEKAHVTDWTELPDGVVDDISRRLAVPDVVSMGVTCKSWRSILADKTPSSQILGLPWCMHVNCDDSRIGECYSMAENSRVRNLYFPEAWKRNCWGSIQDWLVVSQINSGLLEVFFYNPFSEAKLMICPPSAIHHYYKMVVSTSPAAEGCVYVLLDKSLHDIACWTRGIPKWRRYHLASLEDFEDAVFCDGCFYFVTRDFNIYTMELDKMVSAMKGCSTDPNDIVNFECRHHQVKKPATRMTEIFPGITRKICSKNYLVESCGEVLLVLRLFVDPKKEAMFNITLRVFKLDTHLMMWRKMESLGDRGLLLGNSDTRSFSAKQIRKERMANTIYFLTDPIFPGEGDNEWTKEKYKRQRLVRFGDRGSFHLINRTFCPKLDSVTYPANWPPVWITAPIWWYLGATNPKLSDKSQSQ